MNLCDKLLQMPKLRETPPGDLLLLLSETPLVRVVFKYATWFSGPFAPERLLRFNGSHRRRHTKYPTNPEVPGKVSASCNIASVAQSSSNSFLVVPPSFLV